MMAVFGTEEWCDRGEVFSIYFGMFSRLGPVGAKDGRLGLRRPFSATTTDQPSIVRSLAHTLRSEGSSSTTSTRPRCPFAVSSIICPCVRR